MNKDEQIVYEYLVSKGSKKIKPEPDGNVTPDFSIDDSIAIEVRRLNENYFTNGKRIGFHEEYYRLWEFLTQFLSNYKNKNLHKSYWVSLEFERPIPDFKTLKKNLKLKLDWFISQPSENELIEITSELKLRFYPMKSDEDIGFHLVSSSDDNGGGAVLQIYLSNINFCIQEKTNKIEGFVKNYSEWWLILVDRLIYGLDRPSEIEIVKKSINLPKVWKKLLILNPEIDNPILTITN